MPRRSAVSLRVYASRSRDGAGDFVSAGLSGSLEIGGTLGEEAPGCNWSFEVRDIDRCRETPPVEFHFRAEVLATGQPCRCWPVIEMAGRRSHYDRVPSVPLSEQLLTTEKLIVKRRPRKGIGA